jgi:hypothetical protein
MVENIFPLKDDHVKFDPKRLQTRSYKSAPNQVKKKNGYKQEVKGCP